MRFLGTIIQKVDHDIDDYLNHDDDYLLTELLEIFSYKKVKVIVI